MLVLHWSIISSSKAKLHPCAAASRAAGQPQIFTERRGSPLNRLLSLHICITPLANAGCSRLLPLNTAPLPSPQKKKKKNHLAEFSRDFKMTTNVLLFCWRDIWSTNTPTSSNTRPHFMLPKPLIMCCGSRMPSTWRNIIINFVTLQYEQRFSETCSNCAVVCRT